MALSPQQIAEARSRYGLWGASTSTPSMNKSTGSRKEDLRAAWSGAGTSTKKEDNIFTKIVKDAAKTVLVKPADRFAEAVGRTGILGKDIAEGYRTMADEGEGRSFAGIEVEAQKPIDQGGVRQIASDVAKSASYLAPVGTVGAAGSAAIKGSIGKAAAEGAIAGGLGGGLTGLGEGLADEEKDAGEVIAETAGGAAIGAAAGGVLGAAGGALGKGRKAVFPTEAEKIKKQTDYAIELTSPKVTGKVAEKAQAEGRVTAPGVFKASKIVPSRNDELVAESVADIVVPGKPVQVQVDLIDQRLSQINQGVKEMLADRKVPFNKAQLRSRLNAAKADSELVFASEPTAERTYDAVVNEFMKHVEKGDTLGLFEARQSFDKVPAIRKLLETERMGENVRRQIVLDVRRAANEYVAEQLPKNNPYRALLRKESRMLEAIANIAEKEKSNIGMNKIQMLARDYPALKWLIGGLAASLLIGGGVGVGSTIIGSTN